MRFLDDQPLRSGLDYPITAVDGYRPRALTDFTGNVCLTLVSETNPVQLRGAGCQVAGSAVRFHQKRPGPDDKDVRVWTVTQRTDGTFTAVPTAAF